MRIRYGLLGAAGLLALFPWLLLLRQPDYLDTAGLRYRLLTAEVAADEPVSWQSDGARFAYVHRALWNQIAVFDVKTGGSAVVASPSSDCSAPFWSSDGKSVYFFSSNQGGRALWQTSSTPGGAPRLVQGKLGGLSALGGGAISPDGKTLAVWRQEGTGNGAIQSVWTSLTPQGPLRKYGPSPFEQLPRLKRVSLAFNKNGNQISLLVVPKQGLAQLWILPWPAARPRRLFPELESIQDVSWLSEDRLLLTVAGRLWVSDVEGDTMLPMTTGPEHDLLASASTAGAIIALPRSQWISDVGMLPTGAAPSFSNGAESEPSSHGGVTAYVSERPGQAGIWITSAQTSARLLVPAEPGVRYAWLAFSPSGDQLSYTRIGPKTAQLWAVSLAGGAPTRLTSDELNARAASWSPDGLWLTFRTSRAGMIYVEKMPYGGFQATTTLTTASDTAAPQWSPDGNWIAFLQPDGLWIMSPDKDKKLKRLIYPAAPEVVEASGWSVDSKILYSIVRGASDAQLMAIDIEEGSSRVVQVLPTSRWRSSGGGMGFLAVNADGFLATRQRDASEIWMLEGFDLPHGWMRRLWR